MEKVKLSLPLILLTGSCIISGTSFTQTYCYPDVQMACFYGDQIVRVSFAGIDSEDQKRFHLNTAALENGICFLTIENNSQSYKVIKK